MDLYAPPWKVFLLITLPLMAPALVSGWLLAFTLSLDDVVVASFTSGPGASTLPMVVFSAPARAHAGTVCAGHGHRCWRWQPCCSASGGCNEDCRAARRKHSSRAGQG